MDEEWIEEVMKSTYAGEVREVLGKEGKIYGKRDKKLKERARDARQIQDGK